MWRKRLQVLWDCDNCDIRRRCSPYNTLVRNVLRCKASEARRRRSDGFKVEGARQAAGLSTDSYGQLFLVWNNSCVECGERNTIIKSWASSVLADAEKVGQHGTDGTWQHETPYKEELKLVRHSTDLRFEGVPMRKLNLWTSAKVRECYNEVEQEDEGLYRIFCGRARTS